MTKNSKLICLSKNGMLKQISKLIQYFISDGNETFFILCEYGTIKLIESAGQKKDEKKTQDS